MMIVSNDLCNATVGQEDAFRLSKNCLSFDNESDIASVGTKKNATRVPFSKAAAAAVISHECLNLYWLVLLAWNHNPGQLHIVQSSQAEIQRYGPSHPAQDSGIEKRTNCLGIATAVCRCLRRRQPGQYWTAANWTVPAAGVRLLAIDWPLCFKCTVCVCVCLTMYCYVDIFSSQSSWLLTAGFRIFISLTCVNYGRFGQ